MDAEKIYKLFRDAKESGKQIWYFTAPKSLPIDVIQEQALDVAKLQSGKPVFSHDGVEFSSTMEDSTLSTSIHVLVPNKMGNEYQPRTQNTI